MLYVLYLTRQAAEPPLSPASLLYVLYVLYLTRQAAEPPLSPASLLYVLYVLYLTRQAAEPPLSPSSLLYVLYVLYVLYARNLCYMCYIGPYSTYSTYSMEPGESGCSVACLVRYSTYSTYSKEPGESGCSATWHSVRAAFCMVFAWSLHVEQLARFLHDTNSLHGFAWFLHVEQLARFCAVFACGTACMTRTACTVLHVMWLNPVPLPCFFPVRPYVGSSWRTSLRGRAVPSGHL